MNSKIAQAIQMRYSPVAIVLTDHKPEAAIQFLAGKRGCVIAMLNAAAKGRTAVFDRQSFGCRGGGVGLGFGNLSENFPGGIEHFLSTGNKDFCQTEIGQEIVRQMPQLEHGEGYIKTPALAKKFIESLPITDVPSEFILFKPLEKLAENETPATVVLLVNPDQLSALVVLANYARESCDNVVAPFGAGCHQIGLFPYKESESALPRATIGLTDVTVRTLVDKDILSFAMPYKMFLEMESNVAGSFLEKQDWLKVLERQKA
jgi:uncharacterized protein (DUF169 family)